MIIISRWSFLNSNLRLSPSTIATFRFVLVFIFSGSFITVLLMFLCLIHVRVFYELINWVYDILVPSSLPKIGIWHTIARLNLLLSLIFNAMKQIHFLLEYILVLNVSVIQHKRVPIDIIPWLFLLLVSLWKYITFC